MEKLYKNSDSSVVRERCMFFRLSAQKKSMMEVSRIMQVERLRINLFFNAWEQAENLAQKKKKLSIKVGRGDKLKLKPIKDIYV